MPPMFKGWLLALAALAGISALRAQTSPRPPLQAAFFYGYPSLVNGANGDVRKAAQAFAAYDLVILGDGTEFAQVQKSRKPAGVGGAEHARTSAIIKASQERDPKVRFYGYICLGDSQHLSGAEIRHRMQLWKKLGASGVFLDEAGYDWRVVTRARQNRAIQDAHDLELNVMLNSYFPDSLLTRTKHSARNPTGTAVALTPADAILLESFPVRSGSYESAPEWQLRLEQALQVRTEAGAHIVALSTASPDAPLEEAQRDYACWLAWMFDLDGVGWGEPGLSANSSLPQRSCSLLALPAPRGPRSAVAVVGPSTFFRDSSDGLVVLDTERKIVQVRHGNGGILRQSNFAMEAN